MWKSVGSNWTLNVVQILVFLVLTRFVVDALDRGVFGVWESILAAGGPLQLLILGVPMATVRAISSGMARDDPEAANQALGTALTLTLVMGAVTLAVAGLVYAAFDAALLQNPDWNLDAATLRDARIAFWIFVATLAAGFALRLPYAVFDAHHDFVTRNMILGGGLLLRLGLTVLFLTLDASLKALATVQALVALAEFLLAWRVSRTRHPLVRFVPGRLERGPVVQLLSFSIFALLLNMGAMLAFRVDALVVGAFLDNDEVTTYGIGNKIFDPFINLLLAIGMVVMPMATALSAKGRLGEVAEILLKWSKVATCIVLLLGTYLLVVGPGFLEWWIGEKYVPACGRILQVLMVSFLAFLPVRGVVLPVLMGVNRPRKPALGLLTMGVANLLLSVALVRPYGVIGVALGTAIPNVIFASLFARAACRELGVAPGAFARYALGRPFLGALPAAGVLLALELTIGIRGLGLLVGAGVLFVAVYGAAQVLYVWRGDRYLDLGAKVRERFRRG